MFKRLLRLIRTFAGFSENQQEETIRQSPDEELTSTEGYSPPLEARIVRILEENGGTAWQQEITVEMDHPQPRISRTLGDLETADRIVRHQAGRKKLVCLPDQQPESIDSPWERDEAVEG